MANPKRRHSNARTRTRRAHDFVSLKSPSACTHCGASNLPHRICMKCGHYRGRQVLTIKIKEKKTEQK